MTGVEGRDVDVLLPVDLFSSCQPNAVYKTSVYRLFFSL